MSDPTDHVVPGPTGAAATGPATAGGPGDDAPLPLVVDFPRTLRRLRVSLTVIGTLVLVGWAVAGALGDGWSLRLLAELFGLGLIASFAVEVVVVGGSAARGLLAAGERGDRLSSPDVSILPPQVTRRRRG